MKICKYTIANDIDILEQKRIVLRVVVGARSCESWLCNTLDKDRCTRLSETER